MAPVRTRIATLLAISGAVIGLPAGHLPPGPEHPPGYGSYSWPVRGPILRGFEPPPGRYEAGHRGIDIGVPFGTDIKAPREGVVAFAGWVAGALFISIDHPDGVRTTYSWLSNVLVTKGQLVTRGEVIGRTGHGHPDIPEPHLHFGARVGSDYIDPMLLLEGADVSDLIHLAPLVQSSSSSDRFPLDAWLPVALQDISIRGPPARERHLE